jgi:hypothetical protein
MVSVGVAVILLCLGSVTLFSQTSRVTPSVKTLMFVAARPKDHETTKWLILVYTEALRRMGIEFTFKEVPPLRASDYSDRGIVDGELSRIPDYNTYHTNLIRVEEPHYSVRFVAFARESGVQLQGWKSLRETEYRVDYRRGIALCERQLPLVIPATRLSVVTTIHQAIQKLLLQRTDLFIDVEGIVQEYLASEMFREISAERSIYQVGVMEAVSAHAFLHKRHQELASQLATVLRTMKQEGLFDTYRKRLKISQ